MFFSREYTSFLFILVGFLEKWTKPANLGTQQRKFTPRHGMSSSRCGREGGLDKPRVRRGVAKLRRDEGLRHGVALFIDMCFCHVLLFRYPEDLSIKLMRTL